MNDTYRRRVRDGHWCGYRTGWRSDADIGYELDLLRWLARVRSPSRSR
jgi:hypothetical protein